MSQSVLGVYFAVVVREKCSLDQLALDITKSMGCLLSQSIERGIVGDYVGEFLGMRLNLYVSRSENAINNEGFFFLFLVVLLNLRKVQMSLGQISVAMLLKFFGNEQACLGAIHKVLASELVSIS